MTELQSVLLRFGIGSDIPVRRVDTEWGRTYLAGTGAEGFVVKTAPKPAKDIAMQVALLDAAAVDIRLPVPRVLRDGFGNAVVPIDDELGFVQTQCPGAALEDIELDEGMIDQIAAARMDLSMALAPVDAKTAGVPDGNPWSIESLPDALSLLAVLDAEERIAVEAVADVFSTRISYRLATLPRQVVHADFNLSNILFDEERRLSGIIDFGDAISAPRVLDVAVTACYLAIALGDLRHPLVTRFLDETVRIGGLTAGEESLIAGLVAARCALMLLRGRTHAHEHPERAAYALRYDEPAAALLRTLTTTEAGLST